MGSNEYNQFCPVSLAADIFCTRWTALILRDLLGGSTRFNELQRGVPRISSALLTKRLREMEASGLIRREGSTNPAYLLTEKGAELAPIVYGLGRWGIKWIDPELSLERLDVELLMWMMSRGFDATPPPERRCVVQFDYPRLPQGYQRFWLMVDSGSVDLCATDPGFEVDVYVQAELRAMTAIWMGLSRPRQQIEEGTLEIVGNRDLVKLFIVWLSRSPMGLARQEIEAECGHLDLARMRADGSAAVHQ
jgi:DNA-binding HxlR family transcriptional regulator